MQKQSTANKLYTIVFLFFYPFKRVLVFSSSRHHCTEDLLITVLIVCFLSLPSKEKQYQMLPFGLKSYKIIRMEKQSVFEHLANRFSECQVEIRRGKDWFDWDKSDVMFTAGKALFAEISSKEIDFGDTPDWFTKEPKGWAIDSTGQDRQFCSWDLYWLSAIKWLDKNKPDSGITFPSGIGRIKPGEHLCSEKGVTGLLFLLRLRNENLKRVWLELAKASEDACSYLVRILSNKPAETEQKTAPKSKIKVFFWTLYEKTLKVIVDVVVEKMWRG